MHSRLTGLALAATLTLVSGCGITLNPAEDGSDPTSPGAPEQAAPSPAAPGDATESDPEETPTGSPTGTGTDAPTNGTVDGEETVEDLDGDVTPDTLLLTSGVTQPGAVASTAARRDGPVTLEAECVGGGSVVIGLTTPEGLQTYGVECAEGERLVQPVGVLSTGAGLRLEVSGLTGQQYVVRLRDRGPGST